MSLDNRIGNKIPWFVDDKVPSGIKRDSGPYIGIVKNNADPTRSGRLQVFIPDFAGDETNQAHWNTVSYASPFLGAVRRPQIKSGKSKENDYTKVNHAYGMWFTPPDIGNHVVVMFINGDTNRGIWFACVMPDLSHYAIPAQAGAVKLETPKDAKLAEVLTSPPYPAVEFNEENQVLRNEWSNFLEINKPVHEEQVKILLDQGLEDDKVRGVITSSSQRESPSRVFGISTPGVEDPDDTPNPETKNPNYRLGGHSFVMDDGDVNGIDKLIRLRTSGGHQILMNDTEDIIYISNSTGTTWMEFTGDGKIHIFSHSDFSLRSNSNINLHADKDINMFAHDNIRMFAGTSIREQSELITLKAINELNAYAGKMEISSGSSLNIVAATQGTWGTGTELVFASGMIYINEKPAVSVTAPENIPVVEFKDTIPTKMSKDSPYTKWKHVGKVSSTVPIVPTHEPYVTEHISAPPSNTVTTTRGESPPIVTNAVTSSDGTTWTDGSGNPITSGTPTPTPSSVTGAGVTRPAGPADLANQPPSIKGVGTLSAQETTALKAQIGKSESNGNYTAENQLGYVGKYQMGAAALQDQGYVKPGTTNKGLNDPANWTGKDGITSKDTFKSAPDVQEKIMDKNLENNYKALSAKGAITGNSSSEDVAGKLSVAHLLGASGANKWANGQGGADANGTTGDTYYNRGRYSVAVLANSNSAPTNVASVKSGNITGVA